MKLSGKQLDILNAIQAKLLLGDIGLIAEKVNMSTVHVSRVLNPKVDIYNEEIVDAAVEIIDARESKLDEHLQKLGNTNI